MGNSSIIGIVVLMGNSWALFLSGGELSRWGVVLEPLERALTCPGTNFYSDF